MTDLTLDYCAVCGNSKSNHRMVGHPFEVRSISSTGGEKGTKEERYDLIPTEALALVAKLYGFGAKKYAENNWRRGYEWSKSYAAMRRHEAEFWRGVDLDPETGLPHLAAVVFHALTMMTFMEEQPQFDDRFKAEGPIEIPMTNEERMEDIHRQLSAADWDLSISRDRTIDADVKERCSDPACCAIGH